jgi:predicted permease
MDRHGRAERSDRAHPPRLAELLLGGLIPGAIHREAVLGDLHQEFIEIERSSSRRAAARWYWRTALNLGLGYARARLQFSRSPLVGNMGTKSTDQSTTSGPYAWDRESWLSGLQLDLRQSVRRLSQSPGFVAVVILILALGIGANTATFSFANSILFYDPPVRDPGSLVRLFIAHEGFTPYGSWSYPDYFDVRERNEVLSALLAEAVQPFYIEQDGQSERVFGSLVSGNYFSELGVEMEVGRGFRPEEDRTPATHPVAVIGYSLWVSRFGGDPDILGKKIVLNTHEVTVVGVANEGFAGTNVGWNLQLWVPVMMADTLFARYPLLENRGSHNIIFMIGRLKPGVTVEQAETSLDALMAQLEEEYPDTNVGKSVGLWSEREAGLHPMLRGAFLSFFGLMFLVVGFILLLACINVAGLLLARAAARRREIGIRLSLGATRRRIVRQLLTESILLSFLAGAAGLLFSLWLTEMVGAFEPPNELPMRWQYEVDSRVMIFGLVTTAIAGVLFGLVPALHSTRQDLVTTLKEASGARGGRSGRARRLLVIGQIALSMALLVGAGLVVRSLLNAGDIDLGFEPDNALLASVDLDMKGYEEAEGRQFQDELRERLGALPGVRAVGLGLTIPLNFSMSQNWIIPEDYELPEGRQAPAIETSAVSEDYFAAMGIPVLKGRTFQASDNEDAPPVIVVNEAFANRFWSGEDPIGKTAISGDREYEVVGLVATVKHMTLGEPPLPNFYRALRQDYSGSVYIHVRTDDDPAAMLATVRNEIRAMDPALPVADLQIMRDALGIAMLPVRLATMVVAGFATVALALAAIGLYGVIAFWVSRSKHEIGVRMALGARAVDVMTELMRRGLVLTAIGLGLGLVGGLALSTLMSAVLYDVSTLDTIAYFGAAILLTAVALLAIYLPSRKATKVDPVIALRQE